MPRVVSLCVLCCAVPTRTCRMDLEDFLQRVNGIYSKKKNGNAGDFNWTKWGVRNKQRAACAVCVAETFYFFILSSNK